MTPLETTLVGALILGVTAGSILLAVDKSARNFCVGWTIILLSCGAMIGACWLVGWAGLQAWTKALEILT